MRTKSKIKKFKFFLTFHKEREWLEEMALHGYMLEDVKFGMYYYFRKDTPKHMLYEIDRFDLKRNPNLAEMMEKKNFIDMAKEGGWQEVTHDENLNYYFTKEYEEEGFNDLYNDEESMQVRADKFRNHYLSQAELLVKLVVLVAVAGLILNLVLDKNYRGIEEARTDVIRIYNIFCGIYVAITSLLACVLFKMSKIMYDDFRRVFKENRQIHKEKRLIMTTKGLQKYLKRHAGKGEKLVSMGMLTYAFEKTDSRAVTFVMDTKSMVNERRKKAGLERISDTKDWNMMGNDWQAESTPVFYSWRYRHDDADRRNHRCSGRNTLCYVK